FPVLISIDAKIPPEPALSTYPPLPILKVAPNNLTSLFSINVISLTVFMASEYSIFISGCCIIGSSIVSSLLFRQYLIISSMSLTTSLVTPFPSAPLEGLAKTISIELNHFLASSIFLPSKSNSNVSLPKYSEKRFEKLFLLKNKSVLFLLFTLSKNSWSFLPVTYVFLSLLLLL